MIGIDIVNVDRMVKLVGRETFFKKYFSLNEKEYILSRPKPAETMAGMYACKEAFLKALGIGIGGGIDLLNIEICHEKSGRPYVVVDSKLLQKVCGFQPLKIDVSISHTDTIAIAICYILD